MRNMGHGIALSLAIALVSAACGGGATTGGGGAASAAAELPPYEIGFQAELSGQLAPLGEAWSTGLKIYTTQLNKNGGVNGRKVNVTYADTRFDPATSIAAYRQLVNEQKVLGVFGFAASNTTAPVQAEADKLKTTIVGTGVVPPQSAYAFTAGMNVTRLLTDMGPLIETVSKQDGIAKPKVFIVASDSVAARASVQNFNKLAAQKNWDVVGAPMYFPGSGITSFSAESAVVAQLQADWVLVAHTADALPVVIRALRDRGSQARVVGYWAAASEQAQAKVKDPRFYVYRDFADPSEPVMKPVRDLATSLGLPDGTSYTSGQYYTQGYVMGQLIESVLKACGRDCTNEGFRNAMEGPASSIDTKGLTGKVGFSKDNHTFVQGMRYFHWDTTAGRSVPVKGIESAESPVPPQ